MAEINNRKAAIIGCGFVGAASAFALMESGLFTEIVLIDRNREKAEGEALDISHGLPFAKPMQIYAGDYADCCKPGRYFDIRGKAAFRIPGESGVWLWNDT